MQTTLHPPVPRTVLQVEEDALTSHRRSEMLKRYGFRVLNAPTARVALALADAERPDLVLSNVRLPDATGFLICRQMRAMAPPVLVILISPAGSEDVLVTTGLYGGACGHLVEPVDVLELVGLVMRHVP